jgi:hypothetical protein
MNPRTLALGVALAATALAGPALAQNDPLEAAAASQVAAQAPGAKITGPYLHGAGPKTDWQTVLESGKCYWFSGVAGAGVKKLAMYLWAPGANAFTPRVADAKPAGSAGTMAYCAQASGMYHVQAKIQGSGTYAVGVFAKAGPPPSEAPAAEAPPAKKGPDLAALIEKEARSAAPGATRVGDFFDGKADRIGRADMTDWSTSLEVGKCYWIIGVGAPGDIKELALFLWGPNNKRITESKATSNKAMIGHCPTTPGMFKVQAKIGSGNGDFKVGIYAKAR